MRAALSIVMPIYNEEQCIVQIIESIHAAILAKLPGSKLLAVDDGSTDRTAKLIDDLARKYPQVIPLHKSNGGHGDALLYGADRAECEYVFLMDSDGQTDPADFWILWQRRHESEFLTGVRKKRHDPSHRIVIARLLRYGILAVFGVACRDVNAPFKLMTWDFYQRIRRLIPDDSLTPSLLLCIAAKGSLEKIVETNIRHLPRTTGACSIRYFKLLRFCMRALVQFLRFRWSAWSHVRALNQAGRQPASVLPGS